MHHHDDHLGEHIVEAVIIGSILRSPAGQWLCGIVIALLFLACVVIGGALAVNAGWRHFHPEIEAKEKAEEAVRQEQEDKRKIKEVYQYYANEDSLMYPHVKSWDDYNDLPSGQVFWVGHQAYVQGGKHDCFLGWSAEQVNAYFKPHHRK